MGVKNSIPPQIYYFFFGYAKKIYRFGKELPAFMREKQYLCSAKLN